MPLTPEMLSAWLTFVILGCALYCFVRERFPPDVTSLLAILALLLTGVLTPAEAFAGFSHPATISVVAVLVLTAGLARTGAMRYLARGVLAPVAGSELLLTATLMLLIGTLSAFINNTAAVAVFIPVVLEACRHTGARPGRILMPMAHAATLGGMCTLIGTSTNLAAHEFARSQELAGFSMFELSRVGLPMVAAGFAYILLVGRHLLPSHPPDLLQHPHPQRYYTAEPVVTDGSSWIGRAIRPGRLEQHDGVQILEVIRQGVPLAPDQAGKFHAADRLRIRGPLRGLLRVVSRGGLALQTPWMDETPAPAAPPRPDDAGATEAPDEGEPADPRRVMTELVVLPGSHQIGRTVIQTRFGERHGAVVLALHRPGEDVYEPIATTPIRAGDVLLVEASSAAIRRLAQERGFLVIDPLALPEERRRYLWLAIGVMVAVVATVALGLAPIVTAATGGCAVLILTGCLKPDEAYRAIDWSIVFVLAGSLALGTALEKSGITEGVAIYLSDLSGMAGPWVILGCFFITAVLISEGMSNSGTVLLLGPVAVSTATELGLNPMALIAAVMFGASAAFAMPIGYQTSLMIYGPGRYRARDYLLMGIPLDLLLAALAIWLIPRHWPLMIG